MAGLISCLVTYLYNNLHVIIQENFWTKCKY